MKPEWKDSPEWAEWLAQDHDGWWFAYQIKPHQVAGGWATTIGFSYQRIVKGETNEKWHKTLEQRLKE